MSAHLPRLLLGLLAVLTLVLSLGGAFGVWQTGAPAAGWQDAASGQAGATAGSPQSLRPAASRVRLRDMEGAFGDVNRPPAGQSADQSSGQSSDQSSGSPEAAPAPADSPPA